MQDVTLDSATVFTACISPFLTSTYVTGHIFHRFLILPSASLLRLYWKRLVGQVAESV